MRRFGRRVLAMAFLTVLAGCSPERQPSPGNEGEPWASMRALGDGLHRAADVGEGAPAAGDDRENAAGGRYFAEIALRQIEREVFSDRDFPSFRPVWPESGHLGLVNPDNLYESAMIHPGVEYLVRATRGSTADVVFQVYEKSPGVKGSLRGVSTLDLEDLVIAADGSFEIHVGPTPRPENWLRTDEKSGTLLVRWSHSDWSTERAGRIEIVRMGAQGVPSPDLDVARVARAIRDAGDAVPDVGDFWIDFGGRVRLFTRANRVGEPRSTGGQGLEGQVSAMGRFDLADDEALVLTAPKTEARYQGVQLGNFWFDALEWANRQTSLSGGQAHLGSDGRYHYVIAKEDPGVPNWLDTTGLREGLFFLRFQGLPGPLDEEDHPTAELVKVGDVRAHLPADTPSINEEARREQLAARQIQLQRRYGR